MKDRGDSQYSPMSRRITTSARRRDLVAQSTEQIYWVDLILVGAGSVGGNGTWGDVSYEARWVKKMGNSS